MKKLFSLILVSALVLSLAACGDSAQQTPSSSQGEAAPAEITGTLSQYTRLTLVLSLHWRRSLQLGRQHGRDPDRKGR